MTAANHFRAPWQIIIGLVTLIAAFVISVAERHYIDATIILILILFGLGTVVMTTMLIRRRRRGQ